MLSVPMATGIIILSHATLSRIISRCEISVKTRYHCLPDGTLLETAVQQNAGRSFFNAIASLGFTSVEVSDGKIELSRGKRTELIKTGIKNGLRIAGVGVGLFDESGDCREYVLDKVLRFLPDSKRIMWEAPMKHNRCCCFKNSGRMCI